MIYREHTWEPDAKEAEAIQAWLAGERDEGVSWEEVKRGSRRELTGFRNGPWRKST